MQPSPDRNRLIEGRRSAELAHGYRLQLNKKGCAQKELNLQPAGSGALSNSRETASVPYSAVTTSATEPPTKPEASSGNRNGSVTEPITFLASGHKPYALESRPNIFAFLEAVTLAAAMGAVKVWR